MSRASYGRVRHSFWTDPDVRRLSLEAKALLLYYATSPHSNMGGVYYCPHVYAASETGMGPDDVHRRVCGELTPFLTYDPRTEEVFVHALAKHNIGEELSDKDKRAKGLQGVLDAVHSDWLAGLFVARYPQWPVETERSGDPPTPPEGASKGLARGLSAAGSPSEAIAVHSKAVTQHSDADASGAVPRVENSGEADSLPGRDTPWKEAASWWAPFLREHSVEPERSMSVVQQNLSKHLPETVRDAVLGFCDMRDAGELREAFGWAPGAKIHLIPLNKKTNGRSNLQLAADRWRKKQEARTSRHGMKLIRDVLEAS